MNSTKFKFNKISLINFNKISLINFNKISLINFNKMLDINFFQLIMDRISVRINVNCLQVDRVGFTHSLMPGISLSSIMLQVCSVIIISR